jgi:hypothetical protein
MSIVLSVRRGACTVGRRRRRSAEPRRAAREVRVGVRTAADSIAAVAAAAAAAVDVAVEADRSAAPSASVRSPGLRRRRRRRRRVDGLSAGFWPSSPAFGFVSGSGLSEGAEPSAASGGASDWACFADEREDEDDRRRRDPERLRVRPEGVGDPPDAPDSPDASSVAAASWSADSSADPSAGSF